MQDQESTAGDAVSTPEATLPAEQVTEVFQLVAELVADAHVTTLVARSFADEVDSTYARKAAEAATALGVRAMLAGLLSDRAGGVTADGLTWAAGYLRRELAREAE